MEENRPTIIRTKIGGEPFRIHAEPSPEIKQEYIKIREENPEMDPLDAMNMAMERHLKEK